MDEAPVGKVQQIVHFIIKGPPVSQTMPPLLDRILPWPVRILAVLIAGLLGWMWYRTPLGVQVGGALQYGGLIAISIAVSFWWFFFLLNMGLALLWLFFPVREENPNHFLTKSLRWLTFLNRQMGHLEVMAVWIVLALVGTDNIISQLLALASVIFLGAPVVNFIASMRRPRVGEETTDLGWRRRPFFYLATLLGLILIALLAPYQWLKLLPGSLALLAADFVRFIRHRRWSKLMRAESGLGPRTQHHQEQVHWARRRDAIWGPGLVFLTLATILGASWFARKAYDRTLVTGRRGEPLDYCMVNGPPSPADDVGLFLVSDSQFHELKGQRFVGQMAFADALVPVALRPVELDILSAAPLWYFGNLYRAFAKDRKAPLPWAHLGDMADLSCLHEMDRSGRLLKARFGEGSVAGVAPGNHDMAFTGNFFWSPYWDSACPSGRMEKSQCDELLQRDWKDAIAARRGRMMAVPLQSPIAAITQRGSALVTVSPLGSVRQRPNQDRRGVLGVFLDSSDGQAFDFGVSGLYGTFSRAQAKTVHGLIQAVRETAGPEYRDPLYLVFLHSPLGGVVLSSGQRIKEWLRDLDAADTGDPRLLGVIAAHTHSAQTHSHCIGHRMIPEIVVGSTIDPPQEAAYLQVGPMDDGVLGLRVQTLPAVARPDKSCGRRVPLLTARDCQTIMGTLRNHADCAPLFRPADAQASGRECSAIEHPNESVRDRLLQASRWLGPRDEEEVRADQRKRVKNLWTCICRDKMCTPDEGTLNLDDESYFQLINQELARSPFREQELTCLAWAASAVQRYKSSGMTFADALRCGFDDENIPSAKDYIARIEVTPCQ